MSEVEFAKTLIEYVGGHEKPVRLPDADNFADH